MPPFTDPFTREELQAIRDQAAANAVSEQFKDSPYWKQTFIDLANAADAVDAQYGRAIADAGE